MLTIYGNIFYDNTRVWSDMEKKRSYIINESHKVILAWLRIQKTNRNPITDTEIKNSV